MFGGKIKMQHRKNRIMTSIKLDIDVAENIKQNQFINNFSDWTNSEYRKQFMTMSGKTKRLQELINETELLKQEIQNEKKDRKEVRAMISQVEWDWIKGKAFPALYITKQGNFDGLYKVYCNRFNRKDIDRRKFKLLIDIYQSEVNKNGDKKYR